MTTAHLEAEILKLPRSVRAQLAERLIASLDEETDIEKAWILEADRRYQAYLNGEGSVVSASSVMAAIRKEFNL
ncbi:MAG: addiction module protein [Bacteroidetes bacterium]|nr:addiction module protein [Bacteroidota bacterium]